jgi:sirohydrochlorin ferrochelatase/(2Fe-2S) ferredoxin
MTSKKKAVIIVGHGSRVQEANTEFERLVERFKQQVDEYEIFYAYVELAQPDLRTALQQTASFFNEVIIVPFFLFAAGHVKNDVPLAVAEAREKSPHVKFRVAMALGVHPNMARLTAARVEETARPLNKKHERISVLMVGRGSSDPDANSDFCKLVRIVEESSNYAKVDYSFIAIVKPKVEQALERLIRYNPEAIILQPYLLFPGRLVQQLEEITAGYVKQYPWMTIKVSKTLGEDPLIFDLIKERINDVYGGKPLCCDACQYRVPINQLQEKVGGLNSLLWSIRHSFTHNQSMPHHHARAPIKKHVLVCGNADCVDQGSIRLLETLRRLIKDRGMEKQIKVTKTSCLGCCGDGPTVAVYPDGVWYRRCEEKYAEDILQKHLMKDQLISEIVDQIMQ